MKQDFNILKNILTYTAAKLSGLLFLLLVVFILLPATSIAQNTGTFKGTVVADDNGEPLIGAHVKLRNDFSIGAATNLDGKFSISLNPGDYVIEISFTGMIGDTLAISIERGQVVEKTIRLKTFVNQLQGVEIKVGKFDRRIEDQTVSMEVIKPDLIENKNTTSINTILDYTPGLNILDSEPQIRGGSGFTFGVGSKVGILVDDMPMLSADAGRPYWDLVPVENIEQIEVVKGCASVLSGSNALSGAIYIRTATPKLVPQTKIKAFVGAWSTPKYKEMKWWSDFPYVAGADFLHSRIIGSTDLVIGGSVFFDHGYLGAPKPGPYVVDTVTNFEDSQMSTQRGRFNFKLRKRSKKVEGLNFGVNGNIMYNKTNMTLAWLDDSAGFYRAYPGAVILQDQLTFYVDPFINYYSKLGFKHSFKARVLFNDSEMSNNQAVRSTVYYGDYSFKREYNFLKGFAFIGGVSAQYNQVHSTLYAGSGRDDNDLLNISGYAEFENNFFDLVNLTLGVRLEYFSLNNTDNVLKPVFRAGASLKVMHETYLRFSIGQGFRYPTIAERFIYTNLGSFAVFNNPDLIPETSWNGEVGVKQGFKFASFFGYLDVAFFQQDYKNTVEYLFGFWDSTYTWAIAGFKFLNTGKSRVIGVDVSLTGIGKLGTNNNIKFMVGYNYISPKTLEPDLVFTHDYNPSGSTDFSYNNTSIDPSQRILKYRFLHTVKSDIEFNVKSFSTGVSFKYFSPIKNLDKAIADFEEVTKNAGGSVQPIQYMDYFNNHNNGQFIIDFRISYMIKGTHKVALIANNILNRWYSLRPLKAEPMRQILLQYAVTI